MEKKVLLLGIIFIVFIIAFSGCFDQENNDNVNRELKVIKHSVVTEAYSYNTSWENFGEGFNPNDLPEIAPPSDIYSQYDYYKARYRINGTIKNIAGYTLDTFSITLYFYDVNNTLLTSKQMKNYTIELEDGDTWDFEYEYDYFDDYFKKVVFLSFCYI